MGTGFSLLRNSGQSILCHSLSEGKRIFRMGQWIISQSGMIAITQSVVRVKIKEEEVLGSEF